MQAWIFFRPLFKSQLQELYQVSMIASCIDVIFIQTWPHYNIKSSHLFQLKEEKRQGKNIFDFCDSHNDL